MNQSQHWEDWIDAHGPKLVLFARRWAVDHAQAEDYVQEAFVRFWQSREGVRDQLAYLYQCVRNVAIDAARSRAARDRRELSRSETQPQMSQFRDNLESEDRRKQIEAALEQLPTEQAEVIVLKIWSALTFAQIAEATAAPVGTVASRYRYGLDHLRSILSESDLP